MLTDTELLREAAASGFRADVLEKAIRFMGLLKALRSHPYLKTRVALKGGTALNLFVFDVPRLSVDVDLKSVGAADVDTMILEGPRVEQAIRAVCGRLGIGVRRIPSEYAGGKWRLSYTGVRGPGTPELDVNFLLRTPLWPAAPADSRSLGRYAATEVPVLDLHELAAGKLAALFGRQASRDLFDARELLRREGLDRRRLRLGFRSVRGKQPARLAHALLGRGRGQAGGSRPPTRAHASWRSCAWAGGACGVDAAARRGVPGPLGFGPAVGGRRDRVPDPIERRWRNRSAASHGGCHGTADHRLSSRPPLESPERPKALGAFHRRTG